jgi:hypothetical protein
VPGRESREIARSSRSSGACCGRWGAAQARETPFEGWETIAASLELEHPDRWALPMEPDGDDWLDVP